MEEMAFLMLFQGDIEHKTVSEDRMADKTTYFVLKEKAVPEVLLSGHHANIARWTREKSLEATHKNRPELITIARSRGELTDRDEKFLRSLAENNSGKD